MASISNRDSKFSGTSSTQGGLLDVLLALKSNIMKSTNVATLAEVQSVNVSSNTIAVKPFPLIENELEKTIECASIMMPIIKDDDISFKDMTEIVKKKDIVIVIFLDRNFKQNLAQLKKNQKASILEENSDLHSDKFGVVIGICWKYAEYNKEE